MKNLIAVAALAACAAFPAAAADKAAPKAAGKCSEPPQQLLKKDDAPGSGAEVKNGTPVVVHYTGWLFDGCADNFKGKQFDSSVGRNPFGVMVGAGRVIKGWDEGLLGAKKGTKRTLIIPPDKGYGAKGAAGVIPANATLVFDIEVLDVLGAPPAGAAPAQPAQPAKK